jgi:hypothetical protein
VLALKDAPLELRLLHGVVNCVLACCVLACCVLAYLVLAYLVLAYLVLAYLVLAYLVLAYLRATLFQLWDGGRTSPQRR